MALLKKLLLGSFLLSSLHGPLEAADPKVPIVGPAVIIRFVHIRAVGKPFCDYPWVIWAHNPCDYLVKFSVFSCGNATEKPLFEYAFETPDDTDTNVPAAMKPEEWPAPNWNSTYQGTWHYLKDNENQLEGECAFKVNVFVEDRDTGPGDKMGEQVVEFHAADLLKPQERTLSLDNGIEVKFQFEYVKGNKFIETPDK